MPNGKLSRRLLCVLLLFVARGALGDEPWQRLPPTPDLPAHMVAGHYLGNGARIWYAQWNVHASGAPVLLLHGGYGNSNYFGKLIPVLVRHGYRVITLDSRGHGRSTASDEQITYDLMTSDVLGLLDHLKVDKVNLVGWSDGGIIGLDLAINHPQRLSQLFAFGVNADVSGLRDGFDRTPVFAAYLTRVREEYRSLSPTPARWDLFNTNIGKMWETLPAFTAQQLRSIRVPTTIADGEYDEAIKPEHDRYLAATIPGAKLVILPNVSHFAMLQNPAAFNGAIVDFLHGSR